MVSNKNGACQLARQKISFLLKIPPKHAIIPIDNTFRRYGMSETKLTFELGGRVDIKTLSDGMTALHNLLDALTPKRAGVKWEVDELQAGSATVTLQGESDTAGAAEKVLADFNELGKALAKGEEPAIRFNGNVRAATNGIKKLANSVEYVRFETPYAEHLIYGNGAVPDSPADRVSIGSISGTVQALSNRSGLMFAMYDFVHDRRIECHLEAGQEDLAKDIWGRRARVIGRIYWDGTTGLPKRIRNILNIEPLPDPTPGAYRNAMGAVPWKEGDRKPEDVIREMRDAWRSKDDRSIVELLAMPDAAAMDFKPVRLDEELYRRSELA